jgi:hypothetical protein
MKKTRYGVTRFCLVNAGSHQLSNFPIDDSLSICGNNNIGKTQALQAMQFLFFSSLKQMNFGSFDLRTSRDFFFPSENSFLIMEMVLPTGTFLLGAYGKGPAHGNDYELFAAKHKLNTDDFVEDGRICSHKRLFARWNERGINFTGLTRDEMRQLIYGEYTKVKGGRWDMTLVPLINAGEKRYGIFSQIYRHLLTQSELKGNQLKELLMAVFGDKLNNRAVNFSDVRKEAFREYNMLDDQIKRTVARTDDIRSFAEETKNYVEHLEQVSLLKRKFSVNLAIACREIPNQLEFATIALNEVKEARRQLDLQYRDYLAKNTDLSGKIKTFENKKKEHDDLLAKNVMTTKADIENSLQATAIEIGNINSRLSGLENLEKGAVLRKISIMEGEIRRLNGLLNNLINGALILDDLGLSVEEMNSCARVLNPEVLGLPAGALSESTKDAFSTFLRETLLPEGNAWKGQGFTVDVSSLPDGQYNRIDEVQVRQDLAYVTEALQEQKSKLEDAENAERLREQLKKLKQDMSVYQTALSDFIRLEELEQWTSLHIDAYIEDRELLAEVKMSLEQHSARVDDNNQALAEANKTFETFDNMRKDLQRHQRSPILTNELIPLAKGPDEDFEEPLNEIDFDELVDQINKHANALNNIHLKNMATKQRILEDMPDLSAYPDAMEMATKAMERVDQIDAQKEILAQRHHKAIIDIAAVLANLTQDYEMIDSQVQQFNRSINTRKISNLQRFDIQIRKNEVLMDSIETLVDYMKFHEADIGDMFGKPDEVVSSPEVKRALERLTKIIDDGKHGNLELPDLFDVSFRSIDVHGKETVVEKLDQLGSTGTKMTMKPLLYMCMIRYLTDKKAPTEPFLPFFIDEVAGVDPANQKTIISYCQAMGFTPVFSSVQPTTTARYGVNVGECLTESSRIYVTEDDWQHFEPINEELAEEQLDMIS